MDISFWDNLRKIQDTPENLNVPIPIPSTQNKLHSFVSAVRGNKIYAGERHAILKLPDGTYSRGSYMGPGTHIVDRIKSNDKPLTESDKVAQAHDIRYSMAETAEDAREADNKMIQKIKNIEKEGSDNKWNTTQAKLIGLKTFAEDIGILSKGSFSGYDKPKNYDSEDIMLMRNKLNNLTQQGYGR